MVVGLTGGIGSGKTTVANLFANFGVDLVDADIIAREVVATGSPALELIAAHFGPDVLLADGCLNRSWLRAKVFNEPGQKQWLNSLLHPLIRNEIIRQLAAAKSPYVLLVAPLLIENGLTAIVEQVLVVDVSPETQLRRTSRRDNVEQSQVAAILASQCDRSTRLANANQVIDNDVDGFDLTAKVTELHAFYLRLAKEKLAKTPS